MTIYRNLRTGMGVAVAERTILRKDENGVFENWQDVAHRVALGNSLLCKNKEEQEKEYLALRDMIGKGAIIMSGRHLQHGDADQPNRSLELFSNCTTAATSFIQFLCLMSGAGVGRNYDDDMILVNWDNAPNVRCVLDESHPDYDYYAHESVRDAKHKYGTGKEVMWFEVPDSREGWAKALELWENAAFEKIHKDKVLILDFSKVRPKGSPIRGMQNRPASGPVPLINAFQKSAKIRGAGIEPWLQTMYIDHYFADCVLVGGARRSARLSCKFWKDKSVLQFIKVKRPLEFQGKTMQEVAEIRKVSSPNGFLWTSNNSILVDKEFWDLVQLTNRDDERYGGELHIHAKKVYKTAVECSYGDGTGEPGFINVDKLVQNDTGWGDLNRGDYVGSQRYQINEDTQIYMSRLAKAAKRKQYHTIVNPCAEISINLLGAMCIIGNVVPLFADSLEEAEEAFRTITRALMRVNTMNGIYEREIKRTNRIGVGITGIHEFAWKFFNLTFRDLLDEEKSASFWKAVTRFHDAVVDEAKKYAAQTNTNVPHTMTTIMPNGTVSKLFGLTEGWHLPSKKFYLRWVQFANDDPLVKTYQSMGYPSRNLTTYQNVTIIGFPTTLLITDIMPGDSIVTASEASPEEQYKWLMLGEKYWIRGVDENGNEQEENFGNQISYTLKFSPETIDYDHFKKMLLKYQPLIKCCSVMQEAKESSYEYLPEEIITSEQYRKIMDNIKQHTNISEDVSRDHVDCSTGACPIDFKQSK